MVVAFCRSLGDGVMIAISSKRIGYEKSAHATRLYDSPCDVVNMSISCCEHSTTKPRGSLKKIVVHPQKKIRKIRKKSQKSKDFFFRI